jgi:serine/threonine protein kinase
MDGKSREVNVLALCLLKNLSQISQEVQSNKKSALSLVHRCQAFSPALQTFQPVPPVSAENLQRMVELLKEIEEFLKRFLIPKNETRIEKMARFTRLTYDHRSDMKSFQHFTDYITEMLVNLGLRYFANANINEMRAQDCQDTRFDLQSLIQDLTSLLYETSVEDQDQIQKLQTYCLSLLGDWNELSDDITDMKKNIDHVLSHFRRDAKSLGANESQGMKLELIKIRRSIEDQAHHSVKFPQLISLIDSLNTSLVLEMSAHKESLPQELRMVFDQLNETMKTFHEQSLSGDQQTNQMQQEILDSVQHLQFSQKEETIRNDKLSRLELYPSGVTVDQSSSLGQGAFGEVKNGQYGSRTVAIKIISSTGNSFKESEKKSMENEVLLMSSCSHPCVLQLYGYYKVNPRTWHLVLELCPRGSLWSYLSDKKHPSIPLNLSLFWMSEINCALCYLHQHRIIHRDVKAENVLLTDDLHCKLTDFGLSKQQMESSFCTMSQTHAGSLAFMAPELKTGDARPSHRSDMYAFGVTCYQILSRSPPPLSQPVKTIINYISTFDSPLLIEMITQALKELPKDRLSSTEMSQFLVSIQHSYEQQEPQLPQHPPSDPSQPSNSLCTLHQDHFMNIFNQCHLGDHHAYEQLVLLSEQGDPVCLGYLMIVLSGVTKHPFATDRSRAVSLGHHLWTQFQSQESQDNNGTTISFDHHAAFHLGFIFEHGMGVVKDLSEAMKYYRLSADQGNYEAQFILDCWSKFEQGNLGKGEEDVNFSHPSANQESAMTQSESGTSIGMSNNEPETFVDSCLTADQFITKFKSDFGWNFENGQGVLKDQFEAVKSHHLAADQGNAQAQYNLGVCYENGRGVRKDHVMAVKYYRLAADQGHIRAQFNLSWCYQNGIGVAKDELEAGRLYRLSADVTPSNLGSVSDNDSGTGKRKIEEDSVPSEDVKVPCLSGQVDPKAESNPSQCILF